MLCDGKTKRKCIFEFESVAHRHATKLKIYLHFFGGRRWLSEIKIRKRAYVHCAGSADDLKLKLNTYVCHIKLWMKKKISLHNGIGHGLLLIAVQNGMKERDRSREGETERANFTLVREQTELVEMSKKIIYHFYCLLASPRQPASSVVACRLRKRKLLLYLFFRCGCCCQLRTLYQFYLTFSYFTVAMCSCVRCIEVYLPVCAIQM